MKKIITLLILLSVCTFAFATEGRARGMGVDPIFYEDDCLFILFPQYISHYMNNAYIDAYYCSCYKTSDYYQYSGGLNFKLLGNDFGIYINRDFPIQFGYEYAKLEKAMNLYMRLGGFGFGLDVAMDHYNADNDYYKSTYEENTLGLGGKVGLEVGGFDVAGHVYFATGKSKAGDYYELTDNALLLYGATRIKMFETDKSCVYPKAELEIGTAKEEYNYSMKSKSGDEEKYNYMSIDPGIGLNQWLTDEVLVIAAASCGYYTSKATSSDTTSSDDESSLTRITLPRLELGLEAHLTKWLALRAGVSKDYYYLSSKCDECKDDNKVTTYDSCFDYSFGVGLTFGRWMIDWEICDDLYWKGPFIVTGNESDFAGSFTVKYNFGK